MVNLNDNQSLQLLRMCLWVVIRLGANINVVKRADWTPLMLACTRKDNDKLVSLLLDSGADPFFVNKDGWSCLHISSREGNPTIVKMIVNSILDLEKRGALVQLKSRNGRKPLHTAGAGR